MPSIGALGRALACFAPWLTRLFLVIGATSVAATSAVANPTTSAPTSGFFLEIEAANPQGGTGHLFYDVGQWYNGRHSVRVEMPPGTSLQTYRFAIPPRPIKHLRFDPADGAAVVFIGQMRLLTAEGRLLATAGPERLVSMNAIERLSIENGVARVETSSNDPMLLIAAPMHEQTVRALGRATVGPATLFLLAGLVAALAAVSFFAALRSVTTPVAAGTFLRQRIHLLTVFAGTFLLMLGARLSWLKSYSRPMPFWDEWKAGAIDLIIPLRGGFLDWEALFIPQSEHRILITRLVTLVGSLCNGEWDPRVGMTVSAFFFAGALALVCTGVARTGTRTACFLAIVLAGWNCLPFDPNNLLWGDQSQMYALNFFAVCVLCIASTEHPRFSTVLAAGAASALSLVTMGAGFVAPAWGRCSACGATRKAVVCPIRPGPTRAASWSWGWCSPSPLGPGSSSTVRLRFNPTPTQERRRRSCTPSTAAPHGPFHPTHGWSGWYGFRGSQRACSRFETGNRPRTPFSPCHWEHGRWSAWLDWPMGVPPTCRRLTPSTTR
ncbi:MAG: hypothetical protein U1F61_27005 [Opitutaceae bacterium]